MDGNGLDDARLTPSSPTTAPTRRLDHPHGIVTGSGHGDTLDDLAGAGRPQAGGLKSFRPNASMARLAVEEHATEREVRWRLRLRRCHAEIAATFRQHPMGHSLSEIGPTAVGDRFKIPVSFDAGRSHYTVERRDGREIHKESRLDSGGQPIAQVEAVVKYAVGSGTRGFSYLIEHDQRLFQSSITWYSQKDRYDVSPGYGDDNPHFDRPVDVGCLFCHTNRVDAVEHTVNQYKPPIFQGHAIGCERCHGPGELHIQHQDLTDDGRDRTIVNPRHLEPALRLNVCEQCHLQGDHRVERLGRELFDYRPGLPLIEFFAIYGRADQAESKFVGQVEQMKMSRCFRASQGRLGCISCHDPHQAPAAHEKTAYFRQQCLACHETQPCSMPVPARLSQSRDDSCIECHMPRSETIEIRHAATTDHRIPRKPPIAPGADTPSAARGLPLVLLNGDRLGLDELESLQRELAIALALEGPRPSARPPITPIGPLVLTLLDKALARHPDDLAARRMKARALALSGRRPEAIRVIQDALKIVPTDERALEQYLAYSVDERDAAAAIEPARRAIAANPWSSLFHEQLAFFCVENHDWTGAFRESGEALRLNPFLRFARMFAIQSLIHEHNLAARPG